jgi:hypothetical protein
MWKLVRTCVLVALATCAARFTFLHLLGPASHAAPDPPTLGTSTAAIPTDWLAQASDGIRRSEYEFSLCGPGEWSAPNRSQGLRTRAGAEGIELASRTLGEQGWSWGIQLTRFGREDALEAAPPVDPTAAGDRLEYRRASLRMVEWYANDERGLEQGFDLASPPVGSRESPLVLEMALSGRLRARLAEDGREIALLDENGSPVLRYADLRVNDASGRLLPARMAVSDGALRILVDDRAARYPVCVDPLVTAPSWSAEGNQAGCQFGFSVATAGDVNGDGFSDVIVGAPTYDNGAGRPFGRAFVFLGSTAGLGAGAAWSANISEVNGSFGYFGESVACAGDVNGDGYDDIAVGAPLYTTVAGGVEDEGHVFLWFGGPPGGLAGPSGLGPLGTAANADWRARSLDGQAQFGRSVACAGDVNGDGYDDLIVGAPEYDEGGVEGGGAFVWHGHALGMGASGTPANSDWSAQVDVASVTFGWSVSSAGDVNADGYDEVLVGAPVGNAAFMWLGGAAGLGADGTLFNADWSANGTQAGARLGTSVSTAGDVNGDGYADVIVGAPLYDNGEAEEGRAFAWYGGPADLGANGNPVNADWSAESNVAAAEFGWSVAPAGDVDGDGFAEVVVGAHSYAGGQAREGRAYAYAGSGSGLAAASFWSVQSNEVDAELGNCVAAAGDVNGDGFGDVIVGAWIQDGDLVNEGTAYVYYGSARMPEGVAGWWVEANEAGAAGGDQVACAGDINGDGYSDVIVAAPLFDGGHVAEGKVFVYTGSSLGLGLVPFWTAEGNRTDANLGSSVSSAGDVNNDGYGDIVVGAAGYGDGVQDDEGWAFLWQGSAAGLGAAGTPGNADWSAQGNQAGALFGNAVASAGDVNGDGYADVIVGAPGYDNGQAEEGRALVYLGSAQGLSAAPGWTEERNVVDAAFGSAVSTAGDVNGDGFSDVIVGGPRFDGADDQEGRAWVFHGSANGLAVVAAWFADAGQAAEHLGSAVASAGDVNGDGFSDVIIGAPDHDNGQDGEGLAYAYFGGPAGLGGVPWTCESNQVGARMGIAVASAGDVNADGMSDVLVGATGYVFSGTSTGAAFLWLGSPSGLGANGSPANDDWSDFGTQDAEQDGAGFGEALASAGDVNGDGFSDILVGAPGYSNGELREGRAFCFFGNSGNGMDRAPLQARADGLAPVNLLGASESEAAFRLKARGRSAAGRASLRLEWEVKPLGTAFDDQLEKGPWLDSGAPGAQGSVVALDQLANGLAAGNAYRWRMRVASRSPLFPHGPWLHLPYNGRTETDIRLPAAVVAVGRDGPLPGLRLSAPAPNPTRGRSVLRFSLPAAGAARVEVLDLRGARVAVLAEGEYPAGEHVVEWGGESATGGEAASGCYWVRLSSGAHSRTVRLVRLR